VPLDGKVQLVAVVLLITGVQIACHVDAKMVHVIKQPEFAIVMLVGMELNVQNVRIIIGEHFVFHVTVECMPRVMLLLMAMENVFALQVG